MTQRPTTPHSLPKPVVCPTPGPSTGTSYPGGSQTQPFHNGLWLPRHAGPLPCWQSLMELLESRPKVVLLLGKQAQAAWSQLLLRASPELKSLLVITAPHPSPLAYNKTDAVTGQPNKELLNEAFSRAAALSLANAV
ncbi:uracil-DNA glycosylase family protein [Arthrobacter rhizosphaerae]|uniref:uracil-DNA glycosylase family protein n=1 Tax=Arthrobacter rhizosphaerae TaxID=2855490 RepID=UPI00355873C9